MPTVSAGRRIPQDPPPVPLVPIVRPNVTRRCPRPPGHGALRRLYDDPMEAGQQVHDEQLHSHPLCRFRACRQPDLDACVGDADRQIWRAWFALIAHGGRWRESSCQSRAN